MILSVSQIAEQFGLTRTTILYYESMGLLRPDHRTSAGYRQYGQKEVEMLRQICLYRSVGLSVREVRQMLTGREGDAASLLKKRLLDLDTEIGKLRKHQQIILELLRSKNTLLRRMKNMTKDKWVSIMKAAGFSEDDMHRWHCEFERSAPEDHQEFLQYLHIASPEIQSIRDWSRKTA